MTGTAFDEVKQAMDDARDFDESVTRKVAARYVGVESETLATWASQGIGPPYFKYSRRCVRYSRKSLEAWRNQYAVTAGTEDEND
jgi:hypothetical protein